MKKPYEYYIEKIHQTFPDLKRLGRNYSRIAENINNEIAAGGTGKIAVRELYNYTYAQFDELARFYADNELDHKTFEDAMSGLYTALIESFDYRLTRGGWYKNVNSFSAKNAYVMNTFLNKVLQANSNKYYLTSESYYGQQRSLISRMKTSDSDKEYTRVQIDKEKDDWLEELEDVVATAQPDEILAQVMLKGLFKNILNKLSERERIVVIATFGLDDNQPKSMSEVGEMLNITKQAIKQILTKSIRKLRDHAQKEGLHEFL